LSAPTDPNWIADQWKAMMNQIIGIVIFIIALLVILWIILEVYPILRDRGSRSFQRFQTIVSEQM